ncbi:MAG: glycosyltransferase family 4 protein [Verrucomicrobia bacterium]|nr:MAG: glycosyltransferase family 4 protein [Verrucomicrobiota bacterium]
MRIAQVSTLSAPVCRETGGSVEALVWLLTRELVRLGHAVTVFGTAGSEADGELVATLPGPYGAPGSLDDWHLCEWVNLCRAIEQSARFDVMHSHAYLWGLPLEQFARAPMVHTTHIVPDLNSARLWERSPQSRVTAISRHQWSGCPHLQPVAVIPHGVDISQFTWREKPDDYVCYLGRFTSGKGPLQAIETARKLGMRLLMAGPENKYFHDQIKPLLDGRTVEYVGYVRGAGRDKLLGGAQALLYPIQYPEAFGLVLVEAMLCGTPVAAMRLGAVAEIVEEGVSGHTAASKEEFLRAARECLRLNRRQIRQQAEERFSAERMARDYARVYEKIASEK